MGEAAPCLMRSVSQPFFASCEFKEGDPLRALTTSVSFGRFMTEPLDWEKWSSFSHNRTLEDVQKHSRPGAVAEKKAFFEAHYKKIASKKAAKSPQKENKPPNHSPQNIISPPKLDTHSATIDITQENESSKHIPSPPRFDTHSAIDVTQENESATHVISPLISDTHPVIDETQENESSKPITSLTFSHINEEQDIASCKDVRSPSTNLVTTQVGNFEDDVASSRKVEQEKESIKKVSSEKDRFSRRNKSPENSLSKNEGSRKAPTLPICPNKASRDLREKKRSALQSLHMSMNFKNGTLKTISKLKDRLIQQPLNPKMSVNGVKKNPQVLQKPETINACKKRPTSSSSTTTVTSSFSFRSEERAAKRKEFFQKLEEKGNTKETEKINLQPKSKAKNENKKLRMSTTLEKKPSTNETKVSSSMQKVPTMQPSSPKVGRKSTLRSIKESCCQSPWRPLKPKNFIEINKKNLTTTSMASLSIKKMSKK